jgi:hypothetical protein
MHRSPHRLKPFDETDRAFIIVREAIGKWAARCNLNPEIPAGFRGRTADNWRCLVAIADDLGFGYAEAARAAAVALGSDRQYENQHITLLTDISGLGNVLGTNLYDHFGGFTVCVIAITVVYA